MPIVSGGGGGGGATAPLTLTGTTDDVQLSVVGFAGQSSDIAEFRTAVGGAVWSVDTDGSTSQNGQLSLGSNLDTIHLKVIANVAQSSNMARFFGVGGDRSIVTAEGAYAIGVHSAPADASLLAGECALWFDQTDGAAKLMVKAKQADGTVKTASVALA